MGEELSRLLAASFVMEV
jgi:hypothetical protein